MTARERYAHRVANRRCVACDAGLQPDDGIRCIECAANHRAYATSERGLAVRAVQLKRRYDQRAAAGLCLSCPLPARPGRRRCESCAAQFTAWEEARELRRDEGRAA